MTPPNILYLHSHDTGRFVQPYGYGIPTPRIQGLAEQGVLFRQAFCAAPTCSASRACLLTGQYAHSNGMLGLAHRGWSLNDYRHHIVHSLRDAGYRSALIGEQHVSKRPDEIGYDRVIKIDTHRVDDVAPVTVDLLRDPPGKPFFLSVGFFETHREFFEPLPGDELYVKPPPNLPDTAETRRDMASYVASARSLDRGVGAVLDALERYGHADNTLVICTTDHGIAFPGAKATMTDRGLGVLLIMRGPGGFAGGKVSDALVSHIDIYPTICDLIGIRAGLAAGPVADADHHRRDRRDPRRGVRGGHLPRRVRAAAGDPHPALEIRPPVRAAPGPVLPNTDDSPARICGCATGGPRTSTRPSSCTTSSSIPTRPGTGSMTRACTRRRTSFESAWSAGWPAPGIRCWTARSRRRRERWSTMRTGSRRWSRRRSSRRGSATGVDGT